MTELTYFQEILVSRYRGLYKVDFGDGTKMYFENELVEVIATENGEEPALVAILLAYIKYARRNNNDGIRDKKNQDKAPSIGTLLSALSEILERHAIDKIIACFQEAKWCDIKEVLYDKKPLAKFEENWKN